MSLRQPGHFVYDWLCFQSISFSIISEIQKERKENEEKTNDHEDSQLLQDQNKLHVTYEEGT